MLAFLALLVGVLAPAALLIERRLGEDIREQIRVSLVREARVLEVSLERDRPADLAGWVASLGARAAARVTVIAPTGQVQGDSEVPASGLAHLENHRGRPEIEAAFSGRTGASVRHSVTLGEDMMYVAVPVGAPPSMVLRLAVPLVEVGATVRHAQAAMWLAGLLALLLALALGTLLSRWLTRPVLALTRAARAMSRGDFDAPLPPPPKDELGDLVRAVSILRRELAGRIAELGAEGEKLRAVVNGMTEGVALVRGGVIAVANSAFCTLLGASEVEGRPPLEAARLPELGEILEQAVAARTIAEREVSLGGRLLQLAARPLGEAGSAQAVVTVVDATEARRLERLRREWVANASHELRTPVAAIVGAVDTLAAGAAEDPAARASFLDILLRHSGRLSRLTNDLLDLSRLETGYRPELEALPLAPVVEAVVAALAARAAEKQLALACEVPGELAVHAERAALEQILTNLVDNAIKYTSAGGRIRVSATKREQRVELAVEDNGLGIAAEHLSRLFERFYRVDAARSRALGGTGLGLAIVKHLVLAHGGEVRAESRLGRGSRFLVTLPLAG
jgi:two-component system phosphate regulon sensor histidine kinase PhoR